MEQTIYGTSAPHMKGRLSTEKIMLCFIAALIPAGVHGIWRYGLNSALIILVTCACAAATEILFQLITKKPFTVKECRVLLTGLIMSYCLPPELPVYIAALAGVLCGLIMQLSLQFFQKNIVSPVILTRLILMFAFKNEMSNYVLDGLTMATPLALLKSDAEVNILNMIFGNTGGCIGESSAILLCAGAIFLIMVGLMDFRIAGIYLFSFAATLAVFGGHGLSSYYLTAHLAGGGFMLALWYIAPAYSTLPITKGGRWIYGIVLGVLTGVFRLFGPSAENLCFAILIANLTVPALEKITVRRPFGVEKGRL